MAHNQQQLMELWDRADRVCEEAHEAIQAIRSQLETSVGLLAERMGHSVDTRDLECGAARASPKNRYRDELRSRGRGTAA